MVHQMVLGAAEAAGFWSVIVVITLGATIVSQLVVGIVYQWAAKGLRRYMRRKHIGSEAQR